MQNKQSIQFLNRRKFLLVLPLLVLPFVTLAFWALGGGSGATFDKSLRTQTGLNLQLPEAKTTSVSGDKLSFYNKAQEDSIKRRQEMLNDPYYKNGLDTIGIPVSVPVTSFSQTPAKGLNPTPYQTAVDPAEAKIYERLNALNKAVQPVSMPDKTANVSAKTFGADEQSSGDVTRLEALLQSVNEQSTDNTELSGYETMLDKILDIQHPERVKARLKENGPQKQGSSQVVSTRPAMQADKSYFGSQLATFRQGLSTKRNAFYSEGPDSISHSVPDNAITAVVDEAQSVSTGATVKLRLTGDVFISGKWISKGTTVYGEADLEKERLLVTVTGIRYGNNLLPVSLSVYDLDGVAGIYVPGSLTRDVIKQSAEQSLQTVEMLSLDPSLKAQAASAGAQAVKGLFSKKAKRITVNLQAGYRLLLKNNQAEN